MSLGLLAPAALAVGALLGITVLAHLQRRPPRETRDFGATMLLERLPPRLTRRTRIQDRRLLALRLLALALVVLAAAQPELRRTEAPSTVGASGRVLVVMDTSLSMQASLGADQAFASARRAAAEEVRGLPSGVQVALVTAGTPAQTLVSWTTDTAAVAGTLETLQVGHASTDLHGALTLARGLLCGAAGEVLVYTDEAGPGVVEACAPDLERILALGGAVLPRRFAPPTPANIVPIEAEYGDGLEGGSIRVKLANWGTSPREVPVTVNLPDGASMTAFADVPAADGTAPGEVEERFTVPRQAAGGVAVVRVEDAALVGDNARAFHLPQVGANRVLVVDGDPGSSPTKSEVYFLERALAPAAGVGVSVDVVAAQAQAALQPDRHRVVFLANVSDPAPWAPRLLDFVRNGGGLVVVMGDNVTPERWNAPMASLLPTPLRKVRDLVPIDAERGVALAMPDVGERLFKPFSRSGLGGFRAVDARRVMTVEAPEDGADRSDAKVLARWDGGLPALLERQVGTGHVMLWTSSVDLGWTNFPVQGVYMPFMQRLVDVLGGGASGASRRMDGEVGVPVVVELPAEAGALEVSGPTGSLAPSTREDREVRFVPDVPGAWTVKGGDGRLVAQVAVNTPLVESDLRSGVSLTETQAKIAPERMTRRYALTSALVLLAAALLALAGWVGRGKHEEA